MKNKCEGGSSGLVVMGRDSDSEGRGFESQCRILDGRVSHVFVAKILVLEKTNINEKEAGDGPFVLKNKYVKDNQTRKAST